MNQTQLYNNLNHPHQTDIERSWEGGRERGRDKNILTDNDKQIEQIRAKQIDCWWTSPQSLNKVQSIQDLCLVYSLDPQEITLCVLSVCTVTLRCSGVKVQSMLQFLSTEEWMNKRKKSRSNKGIFWSYIYNFKNTPHIILFYHFAHGHTGIRNNVTTRKSQLNDIYSIYLFKRWNWGLVFQLQQERMLDAAAVTALLKGRTESGHFPSVLRLCCRVSLLH